MEIRSEGYVVGDDELSTHLVNAGIGEVANGIKFSALLNTLIRSGVIEADDYDATVARMTDGVLKKLSEKGAKTEDLEVALKSELGIE